MKTKISRRQFVTRAGAGAAGFWLAGCHTPASRKLSANEKLNIGIVGVAGRGGDNLKGVEGENIVALCDIDAKNLASAAARFPSAKTYRDFRRMLEQRDIDAVVVSTPDHTHAVAAIGALRSGRHVYCEKPLGHTVAEARLMTETARRSGLATQMGNQIHAGTNYRRVVELVRSGAIGPVAEVHVWVDAVYQGTEPKLAPVPAHIDYDLWLGPVPYTPYSPDYVPFKWRNWWAFGGGTLSDFCCHHIDLPKWALKLGPPLTVEAEGPPVHPVGVPAWLIVKYEFAARGADPAVHLTWYHGGKRPSYFENGQLPKWGSGTLFVGTKGMLLADYGRHRLFPESDFKDFKAPPPSIPDSIGHHQEWIVGCKTGAPTTCHFGYGGELSETGILGNVAYRVGTKLQWDSKAMKASNSSAADEFIRYHYRKGWRI